VSKNNFLMAALKYSNISEGFLSGTEAETMGSAYHHTTSSYLPFIYKVTKKGIICSTTTYCNLAW
jgi:hypothetical protein